MRANKGLYSQGRGWAVLTMLFVASITPLAAEVPITQVMNIPNRGQQITPLAPRGARFTYVNPGLPAYPNHVVGPLVTAVTSPDHNTLLLLSTGEYGLFNSAGSPDLPASTEWIFVFDISHPIPVQKQSIPVNRTYNGIVWDPSGTAFYVAGGNDDNVHIYTQTGGVWGEAAGSPIALSHTRLAGNVAPEAAGIAITADGSKLIVTNYENDSITVLTKTGTAWSKTADFDLRPGNGTPGGEYPFWVTIAGNSTAYVSSIRDREIDVVNISGATPTLTTRIKLKGQPLKSVLNAARTVLYVAEDQSDSVAAISTATNAVLQEVSAAAPAGVIPSAYAALSGNNTNSVTLSPDESTLYVTNGNSNNVAVVSVSQLGGQNPVMGLIPTGMYPNHVALSADGRFMYVVNGKSPTGPNPDWCHGNVSIHPIPTAGCRASNEYNLERIRGGLQFIPTPSAGDLTTLTAQVAANNSFQAVESASTTATMNFLAQNIKHIIYIIKENRTYDQVLGDLPGGNGNSALTEFPAIVTPNLHNFARNFVNLDNFNDTSEVSYDGWSWSTSAMAPDVVIRQTPVNYSFKGGLSYESEGDNRNINLVYRTGTNASDPNVLPGLTNFAAPDGPGNQINTGYLWDQALRAGLTVRNYGFFVDNLGSAVAFPQNTTVRQVNPSNPVLDPRTDVFFRGFDMNNADFYLYQEWAREFDANYANTGTLPALTLLRLPHDHTGSFSSALAGLNTPELQVADNDYAVGLVVDKIAHSAYANNTLIFVIEDDSQDGGDHVDSHRSIAFIVGPYVRRNAVVSTQYNTINFIRTMERILGLGPIHLTDATAQPMADVFDTTQATWTYSATPSTLLYSSSLPLPPQTTAGLRIPKSTHDASYWGRVTKGLDFSKEDRVNPEAFNRILWRGLKGDTVYPGDATLTQTRRAYKQARKSAAAAGDRDGD